jgi:hypothetical protein
MLRHVSNQVIEWLAAGVLVVPSDDPKHPHIPLSRETIVNRVANLLGASHPEGGNDQELQEKKFDRHILELHKTNVAEGFPATYYQLLEITGDILLAFRPLRLAVGSRMIGSCRIGVLCSSGAMC